MHIAQIHHGDARTQRFDRRRISVKERNIYAAMTLLELYPTEQEKLELLTPYDDFWNGIDE